MSDVLPRAEHPGEFDPTAKQAVYDAIAARRDIRNFRPDPVPDAIVRRLLEAAHQAGSVGLMQPWDFILLRSPERKAEVYELFRRATARAALRYDGDRRDAYVSLKLQGILDAPLCICVTCDTARGGPHVLGRDTIPEMDRYSTCLAVQNLWLAARAEGVGVGWVSIVDNDELAAALQLPAQVVPVAFLCVGYPVAFPDAPMLASSGWRARLPLDALVHEERWSGDRAEAAPRVEHAGPAATPSAAVTTGVVTEPDAERAVAALISAVADADRGDVRAARVRRRLDTLAIPRGSLGRVEALAVWLACAQGRDVPSARRTQLVVFAGDHGVTAEGVSAYRAEVTRRLCYNMLAGGAAINALLRPTGTALAVVDVGVAHGFDPSAGIEHAKVARGTGNIAAGPAMTRTDALASVLAGATAVERRLPLDVLALGEVGIGNTTAAAALLALLTGATGDEVAGAGTGVGPRAQRRKAAVIDAVVRRARGTCLTATGLIDPVAALAEAGGFEIGALAGAMLAAAARRVPVVLDGFITGVAALVAVALAPAVGDYLIPSHRSAERAHGRVLEALGRTPLLELELRLGEGSGAALALPLVEAACALLRDVRTFEEAGIEPPLDGRQVE
ncbi:MAG TPA: nicotinate-nucleotide--dimethylbenzimidazole phosphoribosyltransferase [Gemmatirosa sp.]